MNGKPDVVQYQNPGESKVTKYLSRLSGLRSVIVINEIMYHPSESNGKAEYIEFFNTGNVNISLKEWRIKGAKFTFPDDAVIKAGDYLVLSSDINKLKSIYSIPSERIAGPFSGQLSNSGEKITLLRPDGSVEDEVSYGDNSPWSREADGSGASLELINPALNNILPQAWTYSRANKSDAGYSGTPGMQNSVFRENIDAFIESVSISPVNPVSDKPIDFNCRIWRAAYSADDNQTSMTVRLLYRTDSKASFKTIPMTAVTENRDYHSQIKQQPDQTRLEFYFQVYTTDGQTFRRPAKGPDEPYVIQINNKSSDDTVPVYRIILTDKNAEILENRDLYDNEFLQATFVAGDKIWFDTAFRLRGDSSRKYTKKSYRIDFPEDNRFNGRKTLLLNAKYWEHQYIGSYFFTKAGLPTIDIYPAKVFINGKDLNLFAVVEPLDKEFITKWYPGNDSGNLYRGIRGANLDFRGENKKDYTEDYRKITNTDADDYSDIIELSRAFSKISDDGNINEIKKLIDYEEWITYFACSAVTANYEGIYYYPNADDYFLYRRPDNGKFVILPWDFDSIMIQPAVDFRPNKSCPNIQRFLQHPDVVNDLYKNTFRFSKDFFNYDNVKKLLEPIEKYIKKEPNYANGYYETLLRSFKGHEGVVKDVLHDNLSAEIRTDYSQKIIAPNSVWDFHLGLDSPPDGWNRQNFSDGLFSFNAGFGYNWKNIRGYCEFIPNNSIYIRRFFDIPKINELKNPRLCVDYSNGFIAYLNGHEILRKYLDDKKPVIEYKDKSSFMKKNAETESFDLNKFKEHLLPGRNLIAIQAHTYSAEQDFFVIHPWILAGEYTPYKTIISADPSISIGGNYPIFDTEKVLVNKTNARMDRISGTWNLEVVLNEGINVFTVETINKENAPVKSQILEVFYSSKSTELGGVIQKDLILDKQDSPFRIKETIVVPAGKKLTIKPGCRLVFEADSALIISGQILAEGTENEQITFTPIDKISSWQGVSIDNSGSDNKMKFCNIERAWGRSEHSAGNVGVYKSKLEMEDCIISDYRLTGVDFFQSALKMNRCRVYNGFSSYDGDGIQGTGKSGFGPSLIQNTLIESNDADGIDFSNTDINIKNVLIRNCEDKGISMENGGNVSIENLIVSECKTGIGVKDNNLNITGLAVLNCEEGIKFVYPPNKPAPKLTMTNSVIWNTGKPLADAREEVLSATYSCIQGEKNLKGEGNISVDPVFVSLNSDNFMIFKESPLHKAGKNGTSIYDIKWLENIKWYHY